MSAIQIQTAITGAVSDAFDACEREDRAIAIDVALAREQHAAYVAALVDAGLAIRHAAATPGQPDCVFVEDPVVVVSAHVAVLTRVGVASRRGERAAVAAALPADMEVHAMAAPATLDGGDVLRVADCLFVGLSRRTSADGAAALAHIAAAADVRTETVTVPAGLHLKSACSLADEHTLVYDPTVGLELAPFQRAGLKCVAVPEPRGANVLALGNRRVLVSAAAPATAALLRERGLLPQFVDVGEFHKADGALTCCSLRIPPPGAWCS